MPDPEERLVAGAPVALALVDPVSLVVRAVSPAFAEAVGRAPEEVAGLPLDAVAGPAFAERVRRDGFSPGTSAAFEARLPGRHSRVQPTRVTMSVLQAEAPRLLLALEEPVPGETALLEALPDPLLLIARDGTILESWGRGPGSLGRGLSLHEILPAEAALDFLRAIERGLETGKGERFTFSVSSREGPRRLEARLSPCGRDRVVCLMRDAERAERLLPGFDTLEAVIGLSEDVIYSLGLNGELLSWNAAAERIYGYTAAEVLGRSVAILIPPERPDDFGTILEALRKGERIRQLETVRRHKSGRRVEVMISLSPLRDETGALAGAAVVTRDVTEINRLHRALMEASERERRRFGQDLHEGIGQDLTGVALACRALEVRLGTRSREAAAELRRIGELLAKTIVKTRTLARGLYPVGLDGEALPAFLRELTRMVEETFWVQCDVEWESGIRLPGEAEARSLYWIVQEAVMNAVRHGLPRRIHIRGRQDARGTFISVWDDGKSLGSEPNPAGTGLLVMRSRARAMGAGLTIANHPDGGVLVECRIPSAGPEAANDGLAT